MLELTGGRSAYLSEETWNALDHSGKVACLRLREDRAWVEAEVGRAARAAIADVERRWLNLPRNVTRDELTVFERERKLAAANAMPVFWQAFGPREERCAHAASADGCRVRGCPNQWRPPPPPEDRYYKGALRTQILERDEYRCQYCGKRVWDDLPRDHPDRANIDHVVPYPAGPTTLENGKTACTICNALKGVNEDVPVGVSLEDLLSAIDAQGANNS